MKEIQFSNYFDIEDLGAIFIGKKISVIRFHTQALIFEFDNGTYLPLGVDADCCSYSYFYDFIGVKKIIGKKIIGFEEIELSDSELDESQKEQCKNRELDLYGYKIICEDNNDKFMTSNTAVFSFRNESNGHYGGGLCKFNYLCACHDKSEIKHIPIIRDDIVLI